MVKKGVGADKTVYDNIDWCGFGTGCNVSRVDVKDNRILRVRPLKYDEAYDMERFRPWRLEHEGKVFEQPMHSLIPPTSVAYKKHAFSRNRIPYPLIREDWDPEGDRHPETRGISKYRRISWDEATDIIAKEVKRQYDVHGAGSILVQQDGHGETKIVHPCHGAMVKLLELLGGSTIQARQPDSWEGWYWGAKHLWGNEPYGQGMTGNLFYDITKHTKMLLYWGCDNETTTWGWASQMPSRLSYWFTDCGITSVAIAPDLNYSSAVHADKWIPVYPNTDLALQFAIAYVWMTEGLYDKDYLETHSVGFDWLEYETLGKGDGIPKTPEWAEPLCGVPARTIKALARKWHKEATTTCHCNGGSFIRSCYSHEPARMEAALLTMQGLGKPGRNFMKFIEWNLYGVDAFNPMPPCEEDFESWGGYNGALLDGCERFIPKTLIPEGIMATDPIKWHGHVICSMPTEDQFEEFQFPREGEPFLHMIWSDTPCWSTCWNGGNEYLKALRSENLEFVLLQHPWFENDAHFADIVLPVTSRFEVRDVGIDHSCGVWNTIVHADQCVEPYGEAKSDWECVCAVAEKLGLLEEYTGGRDVEDCIRATFDGARDTMPLAYEEWLEKGYYPSPTREGWEDLPAGFHNFCVDPEHFPLQTPSGKVEFYSTRLAENFPDDQERTPYPHYIAATERFHEYREDPKAQEYPYLLVSNHPRWRVHSEHDDVTWMREIETCKVVGPDGYAYEPVWVNPVDARELGVGAGDVVKVVNDRGWTMGGVYVTERIRPGVVYQDHGSRIDPIVPGESDRAGANNLIAPKECTSANCAGEVTSGFLVGIEKADVFALAREYPEAFGRTFQADEGPDIDNWLV